MKTIPNEIYELPGWTGRVCRASSCSDLPLCRPPLAALATLQITWVYNEFFWHRAAAARRQVPGDQLH